MRQIPTQRFLFVILCALSVTLSAVKVCHAFHALFSHRLFLGPEESFPLEDKGLVPAQIIYATPDRQPKSTEICAVRIKSPDPSVQFYLTFAELLEGAIDVRVNGTWAERFMLHPLHPLGGEGRHLVGAFSVRLPAAETQRSFVCYEIAPNATQPSPETTIQLYCENFRSRTQNNWACDLYRFAYDAHTQVANLFPFWEAFYEHVNLPDVCAVSQEPLQELRSGPVFSFTESGYDMAIQQLVIRTGPQQVMLYEVDPRLYHLMTKVLLPPPVTHFSRIEDATPQAQRAFFDNNMAAMDELNAMAEYGHSQAQFHRGLQIYTLGMTKQARIDGIKWLQRASEQGHAEAIVWLGIAHSQKIESPEDEVWARCYLERAAYTGSPFAHYNFARHLLRYAYGTPDRQMARHYLRSAAKQDHLYGQIHYGHVCYAGIGGAKNTTEARHWMTRASLRGSATAQYILALFLHEGVGGPRDEDGFRYWLTQSAVAGEHNSQMLLAIANHQVPWPNVAALPVAQWIAEGEKRDDARAHFLAAYAMLNSPSMLETIDKAVVKLQRAAKRRLPQALYWLANMHLSGLGVPMNATLARGYLHAAAFQHHPQAQMTLGSLYASGYGGVHNQTLANYWFSRAREGFSYFNTSLVPSQNLTELLRWQP